MNPKRSTPTHIIIKMVKTKEKEKILRAAREKATIKIAAYKGAFTRLQADFLAEILQTRKKYQNIFKMMKGESYN